MFSFIILRYSVLPAEKAKGAAVRRRSKEALFNPERMRMRHWLFEHVCLPSLVSQKPAINASNTRLLVYTSEQLPDVDRAILNRLVKPHPWIEVVTLASGAELGKSLGDIIASTLTERFPGQAPVPYATLRLDDDDALSFDFLARVRRYVAEPYLGMAASFGRGFAAWVDTQGQFKAFRHMVYPNLALGLAYIGGFDTRTGEFRSRYRTIMGLGRHTRIHMKAPVILACRRPSYLRTLYVGQDSKSLSEPRYLDGMLTGPGEVSKRVPLSGQMLLAYDPAIESSEDNRPARKSYHFPSEDRGTGPI